jgi:hypothetical protein
MSHDIYHAYKTSHDFNHDEKLRFLSVNKIYKLIYIVFPFHDYDRINIGKPTRPSTLGAS